MTLAFPALRHDFGASLASVQWVGQSYLLALVGLLPAVGRYADMIGRKLLYTYGFVIFILGSALCGLAPSLAVLIGFRVIQGVGAAMLQANSVAIIVGAVPRDKLGRAIGIQGAAQAADLALGPAAGGLLLGLGGWRLVFFVNVPAGLAGIVLAWFLLPRSRHLSPRSRFDWTGLGLFLPATCVLLLTISYGSDNGWASAPVTGGSAATRGHLEDGCGPELASLVPRARQGGYAARMIPVSPLCPCRAAAGVAGCSMITGRSPCYSRVATHDHEFSLLWIPPGGM